MGSTNNGAGWIAASGIQMIITKNRITLRSATGNTKVMGDIARIDPSKEPKEIDLEKNDGSVLLGIYALDGDSLSITIADPEIPRPSEFKGKPEAMVFRFTRAK